MSDPLLFAHTAREVFPEAIVGCDGFQMTLRFDED
jgi:hypothetical protein